MFEEIGLAQRFARAFERFEIGGRPLRVAISGGSDSVALLCILKETAPSLPIEAVHIDHGLRPESPAEAEFVEGLCARLVVPVEIRNIDVAGFAKHRGIGIEEAARELRYSIFAEFTARGEIVATAHTAGDVVETMLFNLARGTGPRGLSGIPKTRDGIIRPLLGFWREDLQAWLSAKSIGWIEDSSNLDLRFTRNRVRWMLIPEFRRVFGDSSIERLHREAEIFASCGEFIDISASELFKRTIIADFAGVLALDSKIALETRWGFGEILRLAAIEHGISLSDIDFDTVSRLYRDLKTCRRGRRFPVSGDLQIESDGRIIFIFRKLPIFNEIAESAPAGIELPHGLGSLDISCEEGRAEVSIRPLRDGDIFNNNKHLKRYLYRRGVPRILRELAPVVFYSDSPIFSPIIGRICPSKLTIEYNGPLSTLKRKKGV